MHLSCTLTYCVCAQVQILGARRLTSHAAMPVNYSTDLRWRAVWLVTLRGMSYEEVGKILFISERSVRSRYVWLPLVATFDTPAFSQKWPKLVILSVAAKFGKNKITNEQPLWQ